MSPNKHLKGSGYPLPGLLHLCNERPDLLSLVMNCLSVSSLVCPVMPAEWSQGSPLCFGCQVWVVLGGERRFYGEWLCFLTTQSPFVMCNEGCVRYWWVPTGRARDSETSDCGYIFVLRRQGISLEMTSGTVGATWYGTNLCNWDQTVKPGLTVSETKLTETHMRSKFAYKKGGVAHWRCFFHDAGVQFLTWCARTGLSEWWCISGFFRCISVVYNNRQCTVMERTSLRVQPLPRAARKSEWLRSVLAHHHCPDPCVENEIVVLATGIDQYLQEVFHHLAYPNRNDTMSAEDFITLCGVLGLSGADKRKKADEEGPGDATEHEEDEEFINVCSELPCQLSFKDFHSRLCGYFRVRSARKDAEACAWRLPVTEDTELLERQIRLRWPRVRRRKCVSFDLTKNQNKPDTRLAKSRTAENSEPGNQDS